MIDPPCYDPEDDFWKSREDEMTTPRIDVWSALFILLAMVIVVFGVFVIFPTKPADAAQIQEKCTPESTGLKYVTIEGSGIASIFFVIPLLALAPLASATDVNGQYRCHVQVIGRDALGAKAKRNYRPTAEPY